MSNEAPQNLLANEEALRKLVRELVHESDLQTITAKQLRRGLEKRLTLPEKTLDAPDFKADINKLLEEECAAYLRAQQSEAQQDEPEVDSADNAEEMASSDEANEESADVSSHSEQEEESAPQTQPKRQAKQPSSRSKTETPKKKASAKTPARISDTDAKKIDALKKYIVKCGVRKMWTKELAGLETGRQQIAHLNELLRSLGMRGRPTLEKCEDIRLQRELEAERDGLDSIMTTRKRGASSQDEEDEMPRRRRRGQRVEVVIKAPSELDTDDNSNDSNDDDDDDEEEDNEDEKDDNEDGMDEDASHSEDDDEEQDHQEIDSDSDEYEDSDA
ncbi:hypothetical protein THASP1DRAFT_31695 [Thamnocephalis sphaerospora]|uniref:DEK-C domain-containing protein n=1 Tax=Thamnocephalis sphaerospora TaxID=78915 RepID=A0A4P9XMJ4_9FUNG|nr:hypothetical protein THASP1DRAFT_31695 [Thamnocephalis sphaerospora]|eukprot:RKP06490.1 hypothetical protein THASP1DRAFT_31695 [Thamnocephalis sphaerospora]